MTAWSNQKHIRLNQLLIRKQAGVLTIAEGEELTQLKQEWQTHHTLQHSEVASLQQLLYAIQLEQEELAALLQKIEDTREG